jgi:hypothetical protein
MQLRPVGYVGKPRVARDVSDRPSYAGKHRRCTDDQILIHRRAGQGSIVPWKVRSLRQRCQMNVRTVVTTRLTSGVVMARPDRKPHPDPGTRALPPGRRPGRRRRTLMDVWFRGRRCWIGSGVWPVRGVVTSNLVTARSSADLKTVARRCRISFAIRGVRLRTADFSLIA